MPTASSADYVKPSIFAVNDNTAIGVMAAAHTLGLRIPEDLSLVGYNDIPIVNRLPVPLSTVASRSNRSP
jgi:LacI family transcriptional regulator